MDSSRLPITFPTESSSNPISLSSIYTSQWQQITELLNIYNQQNLEIANNTSTFVEEERKPKVAKSAEIHTSPNHMGTVSALKNEEANQRSGSVAKNQCPICLTEVDRGSLEAHYKLELSKVDEINTDSTTIPDIESTTNSSRNKREAALFARKKFQKQMEPQTTKGDASNPLEILKSVRQNRASRRKDKPSSPVTHSVVRKTKAPTQECFICGEKLFGNLDDINEHVDSCLGKQEGINNSKKPKKSTSKRKTRGNKEAEEYQDENVETYTWGGETRVRTCSLLENGYTGLFGVSNNKASPQEDEAELDIENDEISKFGASQYSENDLIIREEEEETKTIRERVSGANTTESKITPEIKQEVPKQEVISNNSTMETSASLLLDALKEKLREQETRLTNSYKCLICMESYDTPLVSVNCWHVHCEKCWLTSLGMMKLCPQCKVITSPSDLRKIFL